MTRVVTRGRLAAMIVAAIVVAGGNVMRAASWSQVDGFVWGPFARHDRPTHATTVTGLDKLQLPIPDWRPLRLVFSAQPIDPAGRALVRVTLDPASSQAFEPAGPDARTATIVEPGKAAGGSATVWIESREGPSGARVQLVAIEPLFRTATLAYHALVGAAAGALLGLLFPVPWKRPAPRADSVAAPRARVMATPLAVGTALAAFFGLWAIVKPPFQGPDEVQHHLRATLMPLTPWVCGATGFDVPAWPFRNPLTWNPNLLHTIIGKPEATLTAQQIETLKHEPWWPPSRYATDWIETGVVSYPPLYYWAVFGLGQGATATFGLGPYASVIAYRLASIVLVSALWTVVFLALRRIPETRAHALPIFALLVLNPLLAGMSSIVNPDAVNIPAIVLMFLAAWTLLSGGTGAGLFAAATAIAVMTKPSGLLAALAAIAIAAIWWQRGRTTSAAAIALVRIAATAVVVSWVIFYAWSPTHLTRNPAARLLAPGEYAWSVVARLPSIWVEYLGKTRLARVPVARSVALGAARRPRRLRRAGSPAAHLRPRVRRLHARGGAAVRRVDRQRGISQPRCRRPDAAGALFPAGDARDRPRGDAAATRLVVHRARLPGAHERRAAAAHRRALLRRPARRLVAGGDVLDVTRRHCSW